jgi:thiamine-phosphate pyrophosphorylase
MEEMKAFAETAAEPRVGPVDWTLYVVTDSRLIGPRPLAEVVAAAIRGGAGIIQYREKNLDTRHMIESAEGLRRVCRQMGALFLVNDRLDVALAVDADGVHLGRNDMPVHIARRLLGKCKLLGVSIQDGAGMDEAVRAGADYLSLSPVFATPTKPDHEEPLGLEAVRRLSAQSMLPVVAIGGINHTNVADVMRTGVKGVCVISAVLTAPDPELAARELYLLAKAAGTER